MAHTSQHGSPNLDPDQLAKMGYETRDIALNTLSRWLVGLFVFIGVATFGSLGLYNLLVPNYAETERVSPMEHVRTYPPNPQLQARPKRDMIDYRAAEGKVEKNYTRGENGTVNLPIDRAMDPWLSVGISGDKGNQPAAPGAITAWLPTRLPGRDNPAAGFVGTTEGNAVRISGQLAAPFGREKSGYCRRAAASHITDH
jgi:hypothetical protein